MVSIFTKLSSCRMETIQRSLDWARGRLINVASADDLIDQVSQFIQEMRTSGWHAQQGKQHCSGCGCSSGWHARQGKQHCSGCGCSSGWHARQGKQHCSGCGCSSGWHARQGKQHCSGCGCSSGWHARQGKQHCSGCGCSSGWHARQGKQHCSGCGCSSGWHARQGKQHCSGCGCSSGWHAQQGKQHCSGCGCSSGWHAQQASSSFRARRTWRGARGAPCYAITQEQLRFLMSCAFSVADILHVSRSTVKRHLRHFNLSHAPLYSDMSDLALDEKMKDLVAGNDKRGPEAVRSQLRALGAETQSEGQHASC
ncbi:uncharacterized protein [Salmo salar]|uniref:Uncharacterized protein LOC123735853 n=1 Tax=Salmo salar TaxID=8030 RepID=A0ABM3ED74_SALSA|nr:uncharacterized protein LOC123735853 [Salmo salar]XP_045569011.1 uncharacterized protein LOC123735853 [Salmo salar]